MNEYEQFALIYDEVMDQSLYDRWMDYTNNCVKKLELFHQEQVTILDLACGTGAIAMRLKRLGYTVAGMDLSENMLTLAQAKAEQEQLAIDWLQGDMRSFSLEQPVNLITLYSDSLCYLPSMADVQATFQSVFAALKIGGIFAFDVHSTYQMRDVFPGFQYIYQGDSFTLNWESFALSEPLTVEHVLTIFVEQATKGTYKRFEEVHVERSFDLEVYRTLLQEVGFSNIEVKADFGEAAIDSHTKRCFFCCQKVH